MNKLAFALSMGLVFMLLLSCAGSDPVTPNPKSIEPVTGSAQAAHDSQTHLWGFYDIYIDVPSQTVTASLNRSALFTVNVVNFINGKPTNLTFHINSTPVGPDYVDVDIDVTMTHPFPGLTQYNGYDVRGIFMGDGSGSMEYNPDLTYPVLGTDQFMLPDTDDGFGGPDGYTRWFNKTEFSKGGMPLFQYTKGKVATPGYSGSATLCPYKYYADHLSKDADLWDWMNDPDNQNSDGVFTAGQSNTRNYYLRFPNGKGVKYSYAIIASWKGTEPSDHPANAPEAVSAKVIDESNVYYLGSDQKGGNLAFDVNLWDWDSTVSSSGVMEDYTIFVQSTVLGSVYEASTADMTPTGGDVHYSTYHFEIAADNITGPDGNEYWIIAQCTDEDYSNEFNILNDAWNDPLAAFFRFDLDVSTENTAPVAVAQATPNPQSECSGILFDGQDSYDPDGGTIQKYEWDWENDGTFDEEGAVIAHFWESPGTYFVQLRVTDDEGLTDLLDTPLEITIEPANGWAKTWGGPSDDQGIKTATDEMGNIYVAGFFQGNGVDFDPDPYSEDLHSSNGSLDIFLSKFSPSGSFIWAKTFGGIEFDCAYGIAVDSTGLYVGGLFSSTVDFDPGDGSAEKVSLGGYDCWLSKFDLDGDFQWVNTWGGSDGNEQVNCLSSDASDGIYVGGQFSSTSVDFDPGSGDVHYTNGTWDAYLSKFSSEGVFQWARTWGGVGEEGTGSIALGSGNVYCVGAFMGSVDFDPSEGGIDIHVAVVDQDPFISCIDSAGVYQWAKTWEGDSDDHAYCVCTDASGNVYVAGDFAYWTGNWFDLNPDPVEQDIRNPIGWWDIWLCKLDSEGSYLWGKTWGGDTFGEGAYALDTDEMDNLYVAGYFRSDSVDFDPGPGEDIHYNVGMNWEPDLFLSKFDSSGNFDWAQTWGSQGVDDIWHIEVRCSAAIYLTGRFSNTIDFDPGSGEDEHSSNGGIDAFLIKILGDGEW